MLQNFRKMGCKHRLMKAAYVKFVR